MPTKRAQQRRLLGPFAAALLLRFIHRLVAVLVFLNLSVLVLLGEALVVVRHSGIDTKDNNGN